MRPSAPVSKNQPADVRPSNADRTRLTQLQTDCPPIKPTILLVDDDLAVRESLGRVLATEGWRIISAATGEEALERLAEQQPDLMITDLRMAGVSGWDLLFHENMERPNLPIFVITALPPPVVGGAERFATEFFEKPLDLDALVAAIRHCLEARSLRAKP